MKYSSRIRTHVSILIIVGHCMIMCLYGAWTGVRMYVAIEKVLSRVGGSTCEDVLFRKQQLSYHYMVEA